MRFPTVEYLEYVKTLPQDIALIGASAIPHVGLADLGLPEDGPISLLQNGLYGSNPARERIGARYGVPPGEIFPTAGTSLANFLALAALLAGGGDAVVETPVYSPLLQQVEALASSVQWLERPFEEGFAVDPERCARLLRPDTRVVVLTNLHNPTGVRIPDAVLVELARRAAGVGASLLVDEVYHDFLFDERPATARTLAPNIVTTSSLTKVYGLGNLRFGWLTGPAEVVRRASRINDYLGVVQPTPGISLGLRAFDYLPQLTERSRQTVEAAMPVLCDWLEGREDLRVVWPDAGPVLFPRLAGPAAGVDTERLARHLVDQHRVGIMPGRYFREPRNIRLGATTPPDILLEGLKRLAEALSACSTGVG